MSFFGEIILPLTGLGKSTSLLACARYLASRYSGYATSVHLLQASGTSNRVTYRTYAQTGVFMLKSPDSILYGVLGTEYGLLD